MLTFKDNAVTAVILGNMQDAGLPHAGCTCARCTAAFEDPAQGLYAACLAIVDKRRNTELHGEDTELHRGIRRNLVNLQKLTIPRLFGLYRLNKQPEGLELFVAHVTVVAPGHFI